MSPTAVPEAKSSNATVVDLKAKLAHVEHAEKIALPDNYMYDFKYNHALPTTDVLGVDIPQDADAINEAEKLTATLADVLGKGEAQAFTDLFLDYGGF